MRRRCQAFGSNVRQHGILCQNRSPHILSPLINHSCYDIPTYLVTWTDATPHTPHSPPLQVPVIQVMLGQLGVVTSEQMFSLWRYVVVGATVVAAVLTPSTDPFTQVGATLSRARLAAQLYHPDPLLESGMPS